MAQITWTVLPNGLSGQQFKFSVFVALRLEESELSDGFNWAETLAGLPDQLDVEVSNADGSGAQQAKLNLDRSLLQPSLWNQVFPSSAPVAPRVPLDPSGRTAISYPVKAIREQIETVYKETAERFGTEAPPFNVYEGDFRERALFNFIVEVGDEFRCREIDTTQETPPFEPEDPDACHLGHPPITELGTTSPFYQAYRFYRRSLNNPPAVPDGGWPKPQVPVLDFHQAAAAIGDHPQLLRRLGLVFEGTLPPGQAPDTGKIRVISDGDVTPWTHYVKADGKLLAKPNPDGSIDSDLNAGLLKLGETESRFDVHQMDIDGAALSLGNYAVNMIKVFDPGEDDPRRGFNPLSTEVPALRTSGFVIARNARADKLKARMQRSHSFEGQTSPELYADDVTRGYRLDVKSSNDGVWRSLCQRKGWFLVGDTQQRVPASGEIHDEGFLKGASASSDPVADGDPLISSSKPIYIHEILFNWNGWSPVIKPPGREMFFDREAPAGQNPEVITRADNAPATDFKVQPVFKVEPGTLPKLRFGEQYQLRARAVDLAGNSLPLETDVADDTLMTPEHPFLRFEPIPAPPTVLRRKVVEGESAEHIVIRSTKGGNGNGNGNSGGLFFSTNDRHVAPPSTTLELVLMHGMLDALFNDPNKSFNLAAKSEGTFLDQQIWDTKTGQKKNVPGIAVLNYDGTPGAFPAQRGDGLLAGQYVIHPNNKLLLPYLPDPAAIGVALMDGRKTDQQSAAVGLKTVLYSGNWPDREPFKLIVTSTNAAEPSVQVQGSDFVVRLPPGTMLPLNISSVISEHDLTTKMAIWDLIDPDQVEDFESFRAAALNGQHWMITPRRQLVAVNAVDRPLEPAKFTSLTITPEREQGETFVRFEGVVQNHSHSTGQLDVVASWVDHLDPLSLPGPTEEARTAQVFKLRPDYDQPSIETPSSSLNEEAIPKQDFGDTKHRFVRYRPDATTRYREYFPASFTSVRENILTLGEELELNVLSSARPAAPEVLYVVPTFRWEVEPAPTGNGNGNGNGNLTTKTSRRIGRGLRVYLARPWFSSGDGELLGVVLSKDGNPTDAERRYTSAWGDDPIWRGNAWRASGPSMAQLAIEDFVNPTFISAQDFPSDRQPLSIAEDAAIQVQAVGFPVEYHAERQVWFADIEVGEIDSYFPFVRLALARLQPHSIKDAELSSVVLAQFIQLVNDRVATIDVVSNDLRVSVTGIAPRNRVGDKIADVLTPPTTPPAAPPGFQFDAEAGAGRLLLVHTEKRGPGNSDDEWEASGTPVALASFVPTSPTTESEILWRGNVPRPAKTPASFNHRLVIREIEIFRTDEDTAETLPIPSLSGISTRGRVVYLDVIPLDDIVR